MAKQKSLVISSILLLLRNFVPVAQGQANLPDLNSWGDVDGSLKQQNGDGGERYNAPNPSFVKGARFYLPSDNPLATPFNKDLVQKEPQRFGLEGDAYRNNQERKLPPSPAMNAMDYPQDDFAQQILGEESSNDFIPPQNIRAKIKLSRIPRYLIFSSLKRNIGRDNYMCHFKLCQVGVSGKRLSM